MTEPATTPPGIQEQKMQVQVKDDKVQTMYSNMVRLYPGPQAEELIIDFSIMTPSSQSQDTMIMDVTARVALNYFAAKRLALTLSQAVQRYEQQFGPIELDLRRRVKQG